MNQTEIEALVERLRKYDDGRTVDEIDLQADIALRLMDEAADALESLLRNSDRRVQEEREACAKAVCRVCREGSPLHNSEWHTDTFPAVAGQPEVISKVYCLATPIRSRSNPQGK